MSTTSEASVKPSAGIESRMTWRSPPLAWGAIALTALAMLVAFSDGLRNLLDRWATQEEYSHGYIIPLLCLYFIWLKRSDLERLRFEPRLWSLLIVAAGIALLLLGELSAIFVFVHYAFLIVLFGLVLSYLGTEATRVIAAPLLLLVFAIPLPYFIDSDLSGELQLLSSGLGVAVIRIFDIPVFLEGNVIDLGVYKLQVAEACSGLRYIYPLMSFGFICVYLWDAPFWKRAVIFLSTIPITVFLNSFRIGVIGVLVENFGIAQAEGFLHYFEGWIIFMVCVAILFCEMAVLGRLGGTRSPLSTVFESMHAATGTRGASVRYRGLPTPFLLSGLMVVAAAVAVTQMSERAEAMPSRHAFVEFPQNVGEWQGRQDALSEIELDKLQPTDYMLTNFTRGDGEILNLYVAFYENQRTGFSPHSPRVCIPGDGWQIADLQRRSLETGMPDGRVLHFNRVLIRRGEHQQLVYYWFQQRGRLIANEYLSKWYLFRDALLRNRTDGALVRLRTPVAPGHDLGSADRRLTEFALGVVGELDGYVPR